MDFHGLAHTFRKVEPSIKSKGCCFLICGKLIDKPRDTVMLEEIGKVSFACYLTFKSGTKSRGRCTNEGLCLGGSCCKSCQGVIMVISLTVVMRVPEPSTVANFRSPPCTTNHQTAGHGVTW